MNPKLTDQALADLPLHAGRAELLEEIMSTTVTPERATSPNPGRPALRRGWLVPAAAAALVAAVAVSTFVYRGGAEPPVTGGTGAAAGGPAAIASEKDQRLLLDAPGWQLDSPGSDGDVYRKGQAFLEVTRYPAASYASYVDDREHISEPPAPGVPIQVLGRDAQMWAYSADDHTSIREPVDGTWIELRGQGMSRDAYFELLSRLRMVSTADFEAAMPEEFVTGSESQAAIQEILDGIADVAGPARGVFPMGQAPSLHSDEEDPYQLGAYVAGQVACAWLDQFATATAAGDQASAEDAAQLLATAGQWPVLHQMNAEGDYPEVLWQYADEAVAGQVPEGYAEGLGCD